MKFTPQLYAIALYQALHEVKPEDQDTVLDRFVHILAENGHTSLLDEITAAYEAYERKQQGVLPATVTFAQPPADEGKIVTELNRIFGKNVEVQKKLDPSRIGGILVETGDIRLDASVRQQLWRLKNALSK